MFTWIEFGFVQLREQSSAWNMDKTGSACNAGSVSCVYHDISVECLARQESLAHSNQPTDQPAGAGKQARNQTNKEASKQANNQASTPCSISLLHAPVQLCWQWHECETLLLALPHLAAMASNPPSSSNRCKVKDQLWRVAERIFKLIEAL